MADFPNSPTIGDIANGRIWNGTKWDVISRKYYEKISVLNNVNNTVDIDLSTGNLFELALSDQTTVSFSNPPASGKEQKFYLKLGINNDYVTIVSYDLANASYDNVSFSGFSGVPDHQYSDFKLQSIEFKPDGTKFFVTGASAAGSYSTYRVHEFSISSAWDITTASYVDSYSPIAASALSLFFNSDGTKLYINESFGVISQHNLSVAWDISSATDASNVTSSNSFGITSNFQSYDMKFNDDGTKFYVINSVDDDIKQYSLSTPYDLTTNSYDNVSLDISGQATAGNGFRFIKNGTELVLSDFSLQKIYKYNLSTAYDLSTAVYANESLDVSTEAANCNRFPFGLQFKDDGTKLYVVGWDNPSLNDFIFQYSTASTNNTPTVTWPSSIIWESGSAPTLPELNQTDLLEFYTSDGGTTYYAKIIADNIG